jgi:uncharacterized protein YpmS
MKIQFPKKEDVFKKKDFSFDMFFYWKIAMFIFVLFFILFSVFGFYLFFKVNRDFSETEKKETEMKPLIQKERLDKALNIFLEKENKSKEILESSQKIPDPSL